VGGGGILAYGSIRLLSLHIQFFIMAQQQKQYTCKYCGRTFSSEYALAGHIGRVHPKPKPLYTQDQVNSIIRETIRETVSEVLKYIENDKEWIDLLCTEHGYTKKKKSPQ